VRRPVAFGLNVDPNAGGLRIAARIAAIADDSGLEYVGVQDHPYNSGFLDTLTQLTWLAAHTSRVHLFPNVASLPLRPPAMLAKQAASIDVLSGGRFELGLGAIGPRSAHLVGAKADGWSISAPYAPLERLRALGDIVTESAHQAGRDPDRLVRVYNLMGLVTPEDRDTFRGPVARWVDTLTTLYTDYQMNAFLFWPRGDRERQSHLFAEEVVPAVRDALATVTGVGGHA
jgi:alkanesulfonate monooxygenase SsuD/methylene tetrahydromethanopterin reductase-like flavin-dependent oxidoreductase (luciferase family)